jgi:chromosome segregation ATPase
MGYFFDLGRKLFQDVRTDMKQVIASWDPELATDVEIEQMEREFDKINLEVTRAKKEMEREITEYREKRYSYDQILASAKLLQDQGHMEKAMKQMDRAESMVADLEKEKNEADEATEYFMSLQKELNEFGRKIAVSKQTIEAKRRQAEMAKLKARNEERKAENAKILAGLKEHTSGMASLAQIYDKQREQAEMHADAARRKAEVFTATAPSAHQEEDPEIAAAMAAVSNKPTVSTESFEDRMARLSKQG